MAGTAFSSPATVHSATSAACASGLSGPPLVMPTVAAPQSRAQASVSTISSVRPDWEIATASTPSRSSLRRYVVATDGAASAASRPARDSTR